MDSKTKLEAYEELQPLIQKEIETQFPKLYAQYAAKFGVADIPLHYHNGFDAPNIPGANVLPSLRASGSIRFATNGTRYTVNLTGTPTKVEFYGLAIKASGLVFTFPANHSATAGAVYRVNGVDYTVASTITGQKSFTTDYPGTPPPATGTLVRQSGTGNTNIDYSDWNPIPSVRAHIVGSACLGPSYYFQPQDTTSTATSESISNVIESSSYILVDFPNSICNAAVSEGHLVQVLYTGGGALTGNIVAQMTIPNIFTKGLDGSFDYTDKGYGNGYVYMDVDLADNWMIIGNVVIT